MKVTFQEGRIYRANKIERGDKHDQSIVHLLSTLPGKAFLVEKKGGVWKVTTGQVVAETPVKVDILAPFSPAVTTKTKPKQTKQPKKKKR